LGCLSGLNSFSLRLTIRLQNGVPLRVWNTLHAVRFPRCAANIAVRLESMVTTRYIDAYVPDSNMARALNLATAFRTGACAPAHRRMRVKQSVDRIIYSIFQRFNREWKTRTLRVFTQAA
jgi:hypothetical protein